MTDDERAAYEHETWRRYILPRLLYEKTETEAEPRDESLADATAFRAGNRP